MDVQSHLRFKNAEREQLEAHVAEFIARGGKIEVLENGASSKSSKRTAHDVQKMNVRARIFAKGEKKPTTDEAEECATQSSE